ncbi:hypothetical protein AM493_09270 [Flavobacterium akiainvivens]|uniref:Lipoprotein n=1 Tax=Flavobacterium akiainvivens TaxID=1202724 RepID=A0A0N0RQP9_9FLAO|nr:hypothetical protein [Flavobacterium akiainvivens]KOS06199.1 hypothetical protein AM493_09270 [Flavobacterium akiainvivens]SFQ68482.1 hypothetical protein SAMN05444144_11488 [Flavobacterium akiainvivens]
MKKATLIALAFAAVFAVGCKDKEQPKPKVIYTDNKDNKGPEPKKDSTQIKVADLPVHMPGTKYLMYPVGDIRIYDDSKASYGTSRTSGQVSYAISNYDRFEITGYFENLKFQHVDSTAIRPLSNKPLQIQTATYLGTYPKRQVIVYTLVDSDTNQDSKIDSNDIRSLYISEMGGAGFKKLSENVQELVDWNLIEAQGRVYFRTLEDFNKNGAFDKDDRMHYYYVDLNTTDWTVTAYEPVAQ